MKKQEEIRIVRPQDVEEAYRLEVEGRFVRCPMDLHATEFASSLFTCLLCRPNSIIYTYSLGLGPELGLILGEFFQRIFKMFIY